MRSSCETRLLKSSKGLEKVFWWFYTLCIALPWHSSANRFLSMIQISGNFSLIQIWIFVMTAIILVGAFPKIRISKENLVFILFLVTVFLGAINGIRYGTSMMLDLDMILVGVACYMIASSKRIKQLDVLNFLRFTTLCMNVNGIINFIMYLTRTWLFWGVEATETGRFGAGYFTLFLITGGYSFYSLCVNDSSQVISRKSAVLNLLLTIFAFTVSAVRTNLLVLMLICASIYVITITTKASKNQRVFRIIIIVIGICVVSYMLYGSSILSDRFSSGNSFLKEGNFTIRISTFAYYLNELKSKPIFGYGLGYMLHFVHPSGFALEDQLSIDNSFMYIAIKMGIISVVTFFFLIVVIPIKKILMNQALRASKFPIIIMYFGFVFATSVMTNQIVYTYADLIFAWTFIGILCNKGSQVQEVKI